jgi:hypothetical protein
MDEMRRLARGLSIIERSIGRFPRAVNPPTTNAQRIFEIVSTFLSAPGSKKLILRILAQFN